MAARQATLPVAVESVATGNESCWGRRRLPPPEVDRDFHPATTKHGTGLTNIPDGVNGLDGTVAVTSSIGAGTRVLGKVPVRSAVVAG